MYELERVTIHCSATPPEMDIGVVEVDEWHKQRGWKGVGYHYIIRRNGVVEKGRDETTMGAHVRGWNKGNIGICLVGGVDHKNNPEDNFNIAQMESLESLIKEMKQTRINGEALVVKGHNHYSAKACPSFDWERWLGDLKGA